MPKCIINVIDGITRMEQDLEIEVFRHIVIRDISEIKNRIGQAETEFSQTKTILCNKSVTGG